MRSNPTQYELIAPPTLSEALQILAQNPSRYTPIAGGTELMVALSAGRLPQKHLLSINHLRELRFIEVTPTTITLGSGTTFTDIRRNPTIAVELPLLTQAASWTGSIANQNRGTLGGNIVNASPAADSPPALLAYDATLTLISASGTRTIPYADFHLSYKKTVLRPDELLHSIQIKRNFAGYKTYIRKVGARNAQAISKIALACLARLSEPNDPAGISTGNPRIIQDIRIGAASLRETPTRCPAAEQALLHQPLTPATLPTLIAVARAALAAEARPIDDIRSTAKYRAAVAANLLEEFLRSL
jgi:CO/xanthine dehydrogenase FAD-binding subunit